MKYLNFPLYLIPFSIQKLYELKSTLLNKKYKRELYKIDGKTNIKINRKEILSVINHYYLKDIYIFNIYVDNIEFAKITLQNNNLANIEINKDIKDINLKDYILDNNSYINNIIYSISKMNFYIVDEDRELSEEEFFKYLINKLKSKDTYYITFDTNALINHVPRKLIEYFENSRERITPNFLISRCVINEITEDFGKIKYCKDQDYINQPKPKGRLFKLGHSQLTLLQQKNAVVIEHEGKFDNSIRDSLIKYLRDKNGKLIFISSDKDFCYNLSGYPEIETVYVKFNRNKKYSWEDVRDFLYISSIILGKIRVKYMGTIKSVWRGKDINDWKNERVYLENTDKHIKNIINCLRKIN